MCKISNKSKKLPKNSNQFPFLSLEKRQGSVMKIPRMQPFASVTEKAVSSRSH